MQLDLLRPLHAGDGVHVPLALIPSDPVLDGASAGCGTRSQHVCAPYRQGRHCCCCCCCCSSGSHARAILHPPQLQQADTKQAYQGGYQYQSV